MPGNAGLGARLRVWSPGVQKKLGRSAFREEVSRNVVALTQERWWPNLSQRGGGGGGTLRGWIRGKGALMVLAFTEAGSAGGRSVVRSFCCPESPRRQE